MTGCRYVRNGDVKRDVRRGIGILWCGQPTRRGSSYCEEHHKRTHRAARPVDLVRAVTEIHRLQGRDTMTTADVPLPEAA